MIKFGAMAIAYQRKQVAIGVWTWHYLDIGKVGAHWSSNLDIVLQLLSLCGTDRARVYLAEAGGGP